MLFGHCIGGGRSGNLGGGVIFEYIIRNTCLFKEKVFASIGNVNKGRPMIMGHFGHTYLMSDVFYTIPIRLVQCLLRYLPTPKSDVLYERSLIR